MTQEEKARAYDEALTTAKRIISKNCSEVEKLCLKCIFPQLAESEDERIRQAIIHYILYETKGAISEATEHTWVKWLEKQKERKPAEWSDDIEQAAARYERENRQCLLSSVDIVNAFIEGARWKEGR